MKLAHHPEYESVYIRHQKLDRQVRQALADWQASGQSIPVEAYGLCWSYESAQGFARSLARMFQIYNQVMWEQFPYCRPCGGQCCVLDASDIRPFDLLATALLDLSLPRLPVETGATPADCIYLVSRRCAWPDGWRTIKCWSFYCLGTGAWVSSDAMDELYRALSEALKAVIHNHLPEPLRRYEARQGKSLADSLDDPVQFANQLHTALFDIFVGPLQTHYPLIAAAAEDGPIEKSSSLAEAGPNIFLWNHDTVTFIYKVTEQISDRLAETEELPASLDRLFADLESLEWIISSRPAPGAKLLAEMYHRYIQTPAEEEYAEIWSGMRHHIWQLWHNWG